MTRVELAEEDPEMVFWNGCDKALIGVGRRCGQPAIAVYDYNRLVACFIEQQMTTEEAVEWVEFNIAGAWVGERTPLILHREMEMEGD